MSIIKPQVSSSSIFISFFIVVTRNSNINLKLRDSLLWTKGSHQSSNLDTFQFSGENLQNSSCHFPSNMSVFLQILQHSSISWKITAPYLFNLSNTYFSQKESIKKKIFDTFECSGQNLSNSLHQFWNDKSIALQILYPSSVWWNIIRLYFFSPKNIHFAGKEPIQMKIFETFWVLRSNFVKFLMPSLKRWVKSSKNFVSLFSFMKDNSSILF